MLENFDLAGKVALVTGGSGGIGGAVARVLAKRGASVAVHYFRNQASASALAAELHANGQKAMTVGGDVGREADTFAIAAAVAKQFGHIDILVNNAGSLANLPFGSVTADAFDQQFHANVLSVVLMTQAVMPYFPTTSGRIINVSTNIVAAPLPGTAIYSATKAAVSTITAGFARELGHRGVTVNAVAPGATDTKMLDWLTAEAREGIARSTPLGRMGLPSDVAEAIAFFASDAAQFITGRTLIIDGGLV